MKISVMITSRNRNQELGRTLRVLQEMVPPPAEVLVTADGCDDGTADMVREKHPDCRLFVNTPGQGSVPSRDCMLREATGDLVLSLDDDSYPESKDFFAKLPALFDQHPEAAVITFPELRDDGVFLSGKSPESPGHYVSAYPNGAAAMRRLAYLETAGFPRFFYHAYEEPDYALQCCARGRAVWFEPGLVVRHHYSAVNRDDLRTHHFNARNELWSVWMRCPWPWLPLVSAYRIWRQFRHACSRGWGWIMREPRWWCDALSGFTVCARDRRPVPWRVYASWMSLARHPIVAHWDWERTFRDHDAIEAGASPPDRVGG